jgi:hypothetical protein
MEHNEQKSTNIKDAILAKIHSKELLMHPKYYFGLRVAGLAVVSVLMLLISVFILNFLLFSIRINSEDVFLNFGPRGWGAFLHFFPWDLLAIDAILMLILLGLLRQFRFGYKSPLIYLLLGIALLTFGAGFVIDRTTGINEHFLRQADAGGLPGPIGDFYGHARSMPGPGQGVCRCTILYINGHMLGVSDIRQPSTTFTIMLPQDDERATTSGLQAGDTIFIAGEKVPDGIRAFGIRKIYLERDIKQ